MKEKRSWLEVTVPLNATHCETGKKMAAASQTVDNRLRKEVGGRGRDAAMDEITS